jgi:hypothetical protein
MSECEPAAGQTAARAGTFDNTNVRTDSTRGGPLDNPAMRRSAWRTSGCRCSPGRFPDAAPDHLADEPGGAITSKVPDAPNAKKAKAGGILGRIGMDQLPDARDKIGRIFSFCRRPQSHTLAMPRLPGTRRTPR